MAHENETIRGAPLPELLSSLQGVKLSKIILFIVDGLRADTFYPALLNGALPRLKSYIARHGYLQYSSCVTTFPPVTVSAHSSILTGTYPGYHGIVGNEWFIRKHWADENMQKHRELYTSIPRYF